MRLPMTKSGRSTLWIVLLTLALVAAACGDDDSPGEDTPSDDETPSAEDDSAGETDDDEPTENR